MPQGSFFPDEVVSRQPCVTLIGRKLLRIEQHTGLLAYREDGLVFRSQAGDIVVSGKALHIARYTSDEAEIRGEIAGVAIGGGVV